MTKTQMLSFYFFRVLTKYDRKKYIGKFDLIFLNIPLLKTEIEVFQLNLKINVFEFLAPFDLEAINVPHTIYFINNVKWVNQV